MREGSGGRFEVSFRSIADEIMRLYKIIGLEIYSIFVAKGNLSIATVIRNTLFFVYKSSFCKNCEAKNHEKIKKYVRITQGKDQQLYIAKKL